MGNREWRYITVSAVLHRFKDPKIEATIPYFVFIIKYLANLSSNSSLLLKEMEFLYSLFIESTINFSNSTQSTLSFENDTIYARISANKSV